MDVTGSQAAFPALAEDLLREPDVEEGKAFQARRSRPAAGSSP